MRGISIVALCLGSVSVGFAQPSDTKLIFPAIADYGGVEDDDRTRGLLACRQRAIGKRGSRNREEGQPGPSHGHTILIS